MKISAKQFFTAWLEAADEMEDSLSANWGNSKNYTSIIRASGDCVIRRVAGKVGLQCYPADYYSLDSVLYEPSDRVDCAPDGETWLRGMSVAFEHENDIKKVYQEVSHLLITNTDLRVLVSYPKAGIEDGVWGKMHNLISGAKNGQSISDDESFLLILGYRSKKAVAGGKSVSWEAYVYKTTGWAELSGTH